MTKLTHKKDGRPPLLVAEKKATMRRAAILRIIERNPGIHHRKLLDTVVIKRHLMAKATAEDIIAEFMGMNMIGSAKDERDVRKVHYYLRHDEEFDRSKLEQAMRVNSSIIDAEVDRLKKEYRKTEVEEKIWFTNWLLKLLFGTLNGYNLLAAGMPEVNQYEKEEARLKGNMRRIFAVVRKDKDYKLVFPLVRSLIVNPSALKSYSAFT